MERVFKCLTILLISNFSRGYACDCESWQQKPDTAIKHATTIIVGKVVSQDTFFNAVWKPHEYYIVNPDTVEVKKYRLETPFYRYVVAVQRYYKGKQEEDTVSICSEASVAICGYVFTPGKEYIIYANWWPFLIDGKVTKMLKTDICTRTDFYTKKEERMIKKKLK